MMWMLGREVVVGGSLISLGLTIYRVLSYFVTSCSFYHFYHGFKCPGSALVSIEEVEEEVTGEELN